MKFFQGQILIPVEEASDELLEEAIEHVKARVRPRRLDEMSTMKYKLEKEKMRREAKALEAAKTN